MNIAETWVKILYTYGPFAILVFLVFVTERKSRVAMKEASPDEKKTFIGIYILNWAAIFGLVVFSVYAWGQINLDKEATLRGTIENLSGSENVTTANSSASLYVLRNYVKGGVVAYEWRLVTRRRLSDGEKINIVFDPDPNHDGNCTRNELTIRSDFYDADGIQLLYNRELNKLFIRHGGKEEELPQSKLGQITSRREPGRSFFTTVVYAQDSFTADMRDAFTRSLESPDPIIRRNARADLANQGTAAVPWMESVLYDPKNSYRLRLGVIVALNHIQNLQAETLKPSTVAAIKSAITDPDEALSSEAKIFLDKYGPALAGNASAVVNVYEDKNYGGQSQKFGLGKYRVDMGQFGSLPNDSASSVSVMKGYKVRLCDNADGTGKCEEWGEGLHQLNAVAGQVSYIYVYKLPRYSIWRSSKRIP
jgi:hypothetical protein